MTQWCSCRTEIYLPGAVAAQTGAAQRELTGYVDFTEDDYLNFTEAMYLQLSEDTIDVPGQSVAIASIYLPGAIATEVFL